MKLTGRSRWYYLLSGAVKTGGSIETAGGEGDDGRGPGLQDGRHRLEMRTPEGRVPVQHALGRVQGEGGGAVSHLQKKGDYLVE